MAAKLIVHGHFYQPPRENPWTGELERQPSAAPFHDWNERVHAECYRANVAADLGTDPAGGIVNNLEKMSFNFGPTLLTWLERQHPATYAAIIDADKASMAAHGYGNAIAQAYHHTILPLSPVRDVRTQVRWGLKDFSHRFGRAADGMWLPETAVDDDVLAVLIEEGVRFTILAPHQAADWRELEGMWIDVSQFGLDTRLPYLYFHPDGSGRSIALWFYDGGLARAIAFGDLTTSAEKFLDAFVVGGAGGGVVQVATDGETYGHHKKFADICLAHALFVEAPKRDMAVLNYSRALQDSPPQHEVRLRPGEGTSWSCAHGVGRWKEDCGCSTGGPADWNQKWRAPLRDALETLRDAADGLYERLGSQLLRDPWGARDRYVSVLLGAQALGDFLVAEASRPLDENDAGRAGTLLALQESSMSMFTSCAWFFNDIGGIETLQILRYAARTIDLLEELGGPTHADDFLAKLAEARSNDPALGTGADLFGEVCKFQAPGGHQT